MLSTIKQPLKAGDGPFDGPTTEADCDLSNKSSHLTQTEATLSQSLWLCRRSLKPLQAYGQTETHHLQLRTYSYQLHKKGNVIILCAFDFGSHKIFL